MPRRFTRNDNWDYGGAPAPNEDESGRPKSRKRRLGMTLAFTTLFFAGASFAAVAGDQISRYLPHDELSETTMLDTTATSTDSTTTTATEETAAPADEAATPVQAPAQEASDSSSEADTASGAYASGDAIKPTRLTGVTPVQAGASGAAGAAGGSAAARKPTAATMARLHKARLQTILLPKVKPAPAPEIEGPESAATIWLNTPLPDPTPPALRLSAKFANDLKAAAQGSGVDWSVMLGILRARGATGHVPADLGTLRKLAGRLGSQGPAKGDWATILAYSGDSRFSDRAAALARYDRAVGLRALVDGLEAAKKTIATRLLSDPMVSIYEGGRNDIIQNKVDVRVLTVIAYLRETFGQVTVSSLISGHRLYARPGVISAHISGHAVDISGLGGTPIQGHQEPGGITERAVREILFLPPEVMPRQVISLLGLGGPSFPLADHNNHIHIGF